MILGRRHPLVSLIPMMEALGDLCRRSICQDTLGRRREREREREKKKKKNTSESKRSQEGRKRNIKIKIHRNRARTSEPKLKSLHGHTLHGECVGYSFHPNSTCDSTYQNTPRCLYVSP